MKKIKTYATGLFLILAGLLSSCIENNVPYPIIKLDITALEVEGETTGAVISTENRTVTVTLADTVNMKKVYIRKVEMTEGARSILRPGHDFRPDQSSNGYSVPLPGLSVENHSQTADRPPFCCRRPNR